MWLAAITMHGHEIITKLQKSQNRKGGRFITVKPSLGNVGQIGPAERQTPAVHGTHKPQSDGEMFMDSGNIRLRATFTF